MRNSVCLRVLDTVDSTNLYLKRLAENGAPAGTAVLAGEQTAGRGRLERSFASPKGGGLYLSILLRPDASAADAVLLTAAAATAAAEAVEAAVADLGGRISVGIKWVNDLYVRGKKLAGILCESALSPAGGIAYAIVGIGINLRRGLLPPELSEIATTVEDEAGVRLDPVPLAKQIGELLLESTEGLSGERRDEILCDYRRRMILFGKTVTVTRGEESFLARATGLSERGELIVVREDSGASEMLSAGEVTLHREA